MTAPTPISRKVINDKNLVIDDTRPFTSDPKYKRIYFGNINPHITVTNCNNSDVNVLYNNLFLNFHLHSMITQY